MNCSPTLTADEFKDVHNGKCDLYFAIQDLENVISPKLLDRLKKGFAQIEKGLEGAYKQDHAAFESSSNHFEEVGNELGIRISSWSLYEVKEMREAHPFDGARMLSYQGDDGEVKVRIDGPLWTDLWKASEEAIKLSGDGHHIFIESFTRSKVKEDTLVLSTGS